MLAKKTGGENVGDDLADVGGDGSPGFRGGVRRKSRFLDSAGSLTRFGCVRNDRVFWGNDNFSYLRFFFQAVSPLDEAESGKHGVDA
jgi:hypothetical protein